MGATDIPLFADTEEGVRQGYIDYVFYDDSEGQHVYYCRGCGYEMRTVRYGLLSELVCECPRRA